MNVSSAQQDPQQSSPSYVDAYSPPGTNANNSDPTAAPVPSSADMTAPPTPSWVPSATPEPVAAPQAPTSAPSPVMSVPSAPPAAEQPLTQAAPMTASPESETLEDQNIFFLLGVKDGTDQQKESFLDELQQVIWEDFLEYDVKLLITSDEMVELKKLLDSQTDRDLEKQEKIIVYLEKLIPDLEEIMLEKALELKEEMVRERASGLRQYYADKPDKLQRVDEAERLIDSGKWYSSAHLMNSLVNS